MAKKDKLPRGLVIAFKEKEGTPVLKADILSWDLKTRHSAGSLKPRISKSATKIEMIPVN